ncbi:50S ribosomal protein L9 [Phaeovibrio sulfidiphilus]|uniref:Large ribosomal subunit protein bL9 n=1 Tax=Phaeovibrio sulfidiphilus TaxID=1220600 RepID=A0A8J6YUB3_9PROT|nr:50S ribosomal protein L9 [Phaeovibrio sulfidiphilus]MBE1236539.1 50S ribosomal protein L9 [Phaeovibrio sulfidiphilus]
MDIILLERIEKLGFMGDIVKVKDGYARNYLLPQKKALRNTKENRAIFEARRVELEALNLKRREEAQEIAKRAEGMSILMIRQASEGGQLYGSVTARDITDALKSEGLTVSRQQIQLHHPIKDLGNHEIRISLHPEVVVTVSVAIARTEEEARARAADLLESAEAAELADAHELEAEALIHEDEDEHAPEGLSTDL